MLGTTLTGTVRGGGKAPAPAPAADARMPVFFFHGMGMIDLAGAAPGSGVPPSFLCLLLLLLLHEKVCGESQKMAVQLLAPARKRCR